MALPVVVKSWQFNVNQTVYNSSASLSPRTPPLAVMNSLFSFGSNPWVPWGSSGAGGGGGFGNNDATDRWLNDPSNITLGSSWLVAKNPVTGQQILFDFSNASFPVYGTITLSPSGAFGAPGSGGTGTDGTADTPPTAGDQVVLVNGGGWSANSAETYKVHVMHSTDGEVTYFIVCKANVPTWIGLLGMPATPITGFTLPVGGVQTSDATNMATFVYWNDAAKIYTGISSDVFACYMTCEGYSSAMVGEYMAWPDDDTGEWPVMPIGLFSSTGAHRGRKASMYDLWWGSTSLATGSTYPGDATNQFAQFGHLIFPWDGSVPEIA